MNIKFGPHTIAEENVISVDKVIIDNKIKVIMIHKISKEPKIALKVVDLGNDQDNVHYLEKISEQLSPTIDEIIETSENTRIIEEV